MVDLKIVMVYIHSMLIHALNVFEVLLVSYLLSYVVYYHHCYCYCYYYYYYYYYYYCHYFLVRVRARSGRRFNPRSLPPHRNGEMETERYRRSSRLRNPRR